MTDATTPGLLHRVGVALYGARWRTYLGRDLGVTYRTIVRWADEGGPIPPGTDAALLRIVTNRARELGGLADQMRRGRPDA